jgi:hypothetical protein
MPGVPAMLGRSSTVGKTMPGLAVAGASSRQMPAPPLVLRPAWLHRPRVPGGSVPTLPAGSPVVARKIEVAPVGLEPTRPGAREFKLSSPAPPPSAIFHIPRRCNEKGWSVSHWHPRNSTGLAAPLAARGGEGARAWATQGPKSILPCRREAAKYPADAPGGARPSGTPQRRHPALRARGAHPRRRGRVAGAIGGEQFAGRRRAPSIRPVPSRPSPATVSPRIFPRVDRFWHHRARAMATQPTRSTRQVA